MARTRDEKPVRAIVQNTGIWHKIAIVTLCFGIVGCSIKNDVPDFKYPSRTDYTDQSWPELAATQELQQTGDNTNATSETAQLESARVTARAQRLRTRAHALQNATTN
ncbi:MAG: hypothetical protein KUG74_11615 [Rhodobacteraceae bacterium]|nr:hypothetical protein [Paracoccaceae bacterium]